jgi:hypothetical protein
MSEYITKKEMKLLNKADRENLVNIIETKNKLLFLIQSQNKQLTEEIIEVKLHRGMFVDRSNDLANQNKQLVELVNELMCSCMLSAEYLKQCKQKLNEIIKE